MNHNHSYDFLGAIYKKTTKNELKICLSSINQQTIKPNKVIIVIDGPINFDIDKVINPFNKFLNIVLVKLKQNSGLGIALRKGLKICTSKWLSFGYKYMLLCKIQW